MLLNWGPTVIQAKAFYTPIFSAGQMSMAGAALTLSQHADVAAVNPAGMTRLPKGFAFSTGAALVEAQIRWRGPDPTAAEEDSVATTRIPRALVPTLQAVYSPKSSPLVFGFALKAPFNIVNQWDPGWQGREVFTGLNLRTVTINPNLAYAINDHHAVSLGLNYTLASLLLINRIPFNAGKAEIFTQGESQHLNVGYLGSWQQWFLALHYNSTMMMDLKRGTIDFSTHTNPLFDNPDSPFGLVDGRARSKFNLPWVMEISLGWKNKLEQPTLEVEVGVLRMGWSQFDAVNVYTSKSSPGLAINEPYDSKRIKLPHHYEDCTNYRGGVSYQVNDNVTWRMGLEKNQAVIPSKTLSPAIPVGGILNFSLGAEFGLTPGHSLAFSESYMILERIHTDKTFYKVNAGQTPFTGSYRGKVNVAMVSYLYSF